MEEVFGGIFFDGFGCFMCFVLGKFFVCVCFCLGVLTVFWVLCL